MAGKKKAIAELEELLPKLDEEGVAFLLEQARVHLHNMEVDRQQRKESAAAGGPKRRTSAGAPLGAARGFSVERADDGETYHLVAGGLWKMFTADEMASMVSIARRNADEAEAARLLHRWLEKERRDALSDFSLGSESGPATLDLVRALRKTFAGRKKG